MEPAQQPPIVVFSTLFPHAGNPGAGLFVRERMFRVARRLPLVVVSPQPWFPFQGLVRRWRPHFRPPAPRHERQDGIDVYFPRFLSFPGVLKSLDGLLMALCTFPLVRRLQRRGGVGVIDAHFAYPDGYAAGLLGRWLGVPVTITLRGTEPRMSEARNLRPRLRAALRRATRIFSVAASLSRLAERLGADPARLRVVANGVDTTMFRPVERDAARAELGLAPDARVMITVGTLVERKGYHRVLALMPELLKEFPDLHYLVVGGAGPEGDWEAQLRRQVRDSGLDARVHFLGHRPKAQLSTALSAADVFVLSTRNEGWANVFLEAMACGLPVVTTDVGGNREVVCRADLGTVVPFGDADAMREALRDALGRDWDRTAIRAYAEENTWDRRVDVLVEEFLQLRRRSDETSLAAG